MIKKDFRMIKNNNFKNDFHSAVFKCDKTKLVLVQVRSSVSKAGKASFVDDLLGWAVTSGLDKVVVLSSLAADERVDCQMAAAFRFLANHKCQAIKEALLQTGMDLKELERKNTFPRQVYTYMNIHTYM